MTGALSAKRRQYQNRRRSPGCVVWVVVAPVIGLLFLRGRAFNILQPTDNRVAVWMDLESRGFLLLQ
jgi:hypothetical protein